MYKTCNNNTQYNSIQNITVTLMRNMISLALNQLFEIWSIINACYLHYFQVFVDEAEFKFVFYEIHFIKADSQMYAESKHRTRFHYQ